MFHSKHDALLSGILLAIYLHIFHGNVVMSKPGHAGEIDNQGIVFFVSFLRKNNAHSFLVCMGMANRGLASDSMCFSVISLPNKIINNDLSSFFFVLYFFCTNICYIEMTQS
jgi:hypothetical protein